MNNDSIKPYKSLCNAFVAFFLLSSVAFAAGSGGISKVNTLMENISNALFAVGAIIMTIAIMWAGFKIMFQGQTLREAAPTLIGGVLIGAASAIAGFIIS